MQIVTLIHKKSATFFIYLLSPPPIQCLLPNLC